MAISIAKLTLVGASILTTASCVPVDPYGYGSPSVSLQYIERIPPHYRSVHHQGRRYYHDNDVYYEQRGARYYRVDNPYVRHSAPRYEPVRIGNRVYYRSQNDWYDRRGSNYIRISDPRSRDYRDYRNDDRRGDYRSQPPQYSPVFIRGQQYYTSNGEYFIIRNGVYVRTRPPGR